MRIVYQVLVLASALLTAPLAKADTLDFTITGQGSTYTFSLDSSPTPDLSVGGVFFRLDNQPINIDNQFGETSDIRFFNSFAAGGVSFLNLILSGPQLYTGTEASPTFLTGPFTLASGLDTYSLTILPRTTEKQDIPISVFKFEATQTVFGILQRFGKGDPARRKLGRQCIGIGDCDVSVPSSRRLTLVVGERFRADILDEDHRPFPLHNGKKGLAIRLLKDNLKTELFSIERKCRRNVSHDKERGDAVYSWLCHA